jgi:hypothetical protein
MASGKLKLFAVNEVN